ncbi:MAG: STAS domain-containing protein [Gammaproteobacteria bacterium]|nr:STAS domain-containing protein [Gammaproteobacteria bacterium]
MNVKVIESEDGSEVTIQVSGRFDFSCYQQFVDGYQDYLKGEKRFVVDLNETEYMDSSAMGMLLRLRDHSARDGGDVALINANESVLEILKIANFNRLFAIAGMD